MTHTAEITYECNVCTKTFTHKGNFVRHTKIHNKAGDREYSQTAQTQWFPPQKVKIEYVKMEHEIERMEVQQKVELDSSITYADNGAPMDGGERMYACDLCEMKFMHRSSLCRHVKKNHTEDVTTEASVISQFVAFQNGANQVGPISLKPYECNLCEARFSRKDYLSKHNKKYHSSNSLQRPTDLVDGTLSHTGSFDDNEDRPHKCDECDKSFKAFNHLQRHKFIHTGERPYECDLCHRAFSMKITLQRHLITHSGEQPYQCGVCKTKFRQKGNLQRHSKRKHPEMYAKATSSIRAINVAGIKTERHETPGTSFLKMKIEPYSSPIQNGQSTPTSTDDVEEEPEDEPIELSEALEELIGLGFSLPEPELNETSFPDLEEEFDVPDGKNAVAPIADPPKVCIGYAIEPYIAYAAEDPTSCGVSEWQETDESNHSKSELTSDPSLSQNNDKSLTIPGFIELQPATFTNENAVLYQCSFCHQSFTSSYCLMQHVSVHLNDNPL